MKNMNFECPPESTPINCPTIDEDILHRSCRKKDSACPTEIKIPIGEQIWQRYTDSSGKCFFYKNNASKNTRSTWEPLLKEKGSVFVTKQITKKMRELKNVVLYQKYLRLLKQILYQRLCIQCQPPSLMIHILHQYYKKNQTHQY